MKEETSEDPRSAKKHLVLSCYVLTTENAWQHANGVYDSIEQRRSGALTLKVSEYSSQHPDCLLCR